VHANDHTPQRHAADPDPDPESLFVPGGDDDNTWDPPNYEQDEEEMLLGWDASNENPNASFHPTFRDSGTVARPQETRQPPAFASQEGLEPTQRLSQLHGMFD
jgi:cell cycle checkpoint control protein RAD9A